MAHQKKCIIVLVCSWLVGGALGCGRCEETGDNTITCLSTADNMASFSVKVLSKGSINMQCSLLTEVDFSLTDGCNFGSVTHTEFVGCTLPNISYSEVLHKIGVDSGSIRSLTISNVSQEGMLTQHHFRGLEELQFLRVIDVHSMASDALRNMLKLEAIEISSTAIHQFGADFLNNMSSLQILMLQHNSLKELPIDLFSSTSNLHTLYLYNNSITVVQKDLFKGLKSLRSLNISKNNLQELFTGTFSDNSLLESIDISENLLSEIGIDTFKNLRVLKVLNLSHNRLVVLPESAFQLCDSLQKVEMSHNFLSHSSLRNVFKQHSKVTYLDLGHNNITVSRMDYFALDNQHNLQYILLNNNNISVIPNSIGNVFTQLKRVDLSRNSIEYLNYFSLDFMSDSVQLNLKYNKLRTIDFTVVYPLFRKKTVQLALEGNPLLCSCYNYGFIRLAQGKRFSKTNKTMEIIVEDINESSCQFSDGTFENLAKVETETLVCQTEHNHTCLYNYRIHDDMILVDCSNKDFKSIKSINLKKITDYNFILNLANNSLMSLDGLQNCKNLINLTVSYNKLSTLNVSHLPPNLEALDVRSNNLTNLLPVVLHHLNDTTLLLGGNPWRCSCDMIELFRFLHFPSRKVADFQSLRCKEDGQFLMDLSEQDLCVFFLQPTVIFTIVTTLIFLILFAVFGTASFYKYKQGIKVWLYAHHVCLWAITEDELDADKKYDAFISYSHKDEEFVTKVLVPGLECGEPKYRVCLHYRDWVPGEYIQNQIMQSVEASRRTIVVLSSSFIESVWGQLEFRAAHSQALQDRTNRIIVIVYGKIPAENELDEKLKLYISTKTYVRWGDNNFWEKLRYIMPHPPDLVQKKRNQKKANKIELKKSPPNLEVSLKKSPPKEVSLKEVIC